MSEFSFKHVSEHNTFNNSSEILTYIKDILSTPSATGFETMGQKRWLKEMSKHVDTVSIDKLGSAIAVIKGRVNSLNNKRFMLEAHSDEIAWYVSYITSNGLIYVNRNGGSDMQIAPSKRVVIYNKLGELVDGFFGWPAIHTRTKDIETNQENLFIDIGAESATEVGEKFNVGVGDIVLFKDEETLLIGANNQYISNRALDNKIGGVCLVEIARYIKTNGIELNFDLYFVNSVQEEIGLKGAEVVTRSINPDVAIAIDVTHHTDTPNISVIKHGDIKCGNGVVLTVAPSINNQLLNYMRNMYSPFKYQMSVSSRYTGTDADVIAYTNDGVPTVLLSIPLKYMHTTNEMCNINDLRSTVDIALGTIIGANKDASFFDKLRNKYN